MAIELKFDDESNQIQLGTLTMKAKGNRVIIVGDEFRTGYECVTCGGRGEVTCENCEGTGTSAITQKGRCSKCEGRKMEVCPSCKGKGGLLEIPEDRKARPTTGRIVSIGPRVEDYKVGESALFTSFSGHAFDLTAEDVHGKEILITIWVLREDELMAEVSGHTALRQVRKSMAMATAG
jgi:co-chaperonin GroES (HSP10)